MKQNFVIPDGIKALFIKYLTEDISEEENSLLIEWVRSSDENVSFFRDITETWKASNFHLGKNYNTAAAWKEITEKLFSGNRQGKNRYVWIKIMRIAAIFLITFISGGFLYYLMFHRTVLPDDESIVEFISPPGSRSSVIMNDGTKIWLNAGSKLIYHPSYGRTVRNVHLEGEAYFEVARIEKIPFQVETSEIQITALGTSFNVKAYSEENTIETTLVEGSLKVLNKIIPAAAPLIMKPNEKVIYYKSTSKLAFQKNQVEKTEQGRAGNPRITIIERIDVQPITSWKDSRWVIKHEKLGDLAIKLERRFNISLNFENDALKDFEFGGTLEDETLEQVLDAISYTAPIHYSIEKNTVVIKEDSQKMKKYKKLLIE